MCDAGLLKRHSYARKEIYHRMLRDCSTIDALTDFLQRLRLSNLHCSRFKENDLANVDPFSSSSIKSAKKDR